MKHRTLLAATVCALLTQEVPRGQAPAGSQQPPTFRVETRAIEVDAFVTDRDGQFVRGLNREDFQILEDGQPQKISAFTFVEVPIDPPAQQSKGQKRSAPAVDSDVVTNATEGRIYVMLLDSPGLQVAASAYVTRETMFRFTQRVARRFVDEALGPNDVMSVIHAEGNVSDGQSFTGNKRLLRESIDRMKPDMGESTGYCDSGRIRNSYEILESVSEFLGAVTGRRKAILWVNGRVPFDPVDECGVGAALNASIAFMYRDAMRAATRNNVAIYPIDSVGLTADPTRTGNLSGRRLKSYAALRGIAEDTGGEAVINTNNFSPAFERIVRANSSYYLIGYHPAIDHHDAKFHPITVRVRQPGLSVRTRKGYTAPGPQPPIEVLAGVSMEAGDVLARALPANGLAVELFLAPFKGADRNGSVVVGAALHGLSREAGADPRVEISYMAIDVQGASRVAPPLLISFSPPETGPATSDTVRYFDRLVMPPGRHELRVAVHQPGGATGSVVAYVEVPDYMRVPLAMSGLVLASAGAPQPTLLADARLRAILAADPTTDRRFARRDMLTAYAEAYTDGRTRVEEVTMTATLTTGQGAKVRTEVVTRVAGEPGRTGFTVRLPLADLAPGDYVLTMEAIAGRRAVTRQVPFAVVVE